VDDSGDTGSGEFMKMILEIPDDLLTRAQAMAAKCGERLDDLVSAALLQYVERQTGETPTGGWRRVFGQARREEVETVDAVVAEELERIDLEEWK
jgi:hypothetical protein